MRNLISRRFLSHSSAYSTIRPLSKSCSESFFYKPKRWKSTTTGSVSAKEVSKFSSLSPTWWDASKNPLISMNPIRIKRILQVMESRKKGHNVAVAEQIENVHDAYPLQGMKALDVGCGGGLLSESLARLGASVTAIDPSVEIVNVAKTRTIHDRHLRENIDYRGGISVEDLASSSMNHGTYDLVCILEVIEHAADPQSLLRSAAKLLKRPTNNESGGTLFISTLNRTSKSYFFGILGAEHVLRLLPIGTHDWNQFKSPNEVKKMIEDIEVDTLEDNITKDHLKLRQLDICGMTFAPDIFGRSFKWSLDSNDLDVNWIGAYGFTSYENKGRSVTNERKL